jgi:uncharacterized protein (DUF934 family)
MPFIKDGQIAEDRFHVLPEGDIPDSEASILVPANRFLADPETFLARNAPTGVLWPNDRRVSELAPHLQRLSVVVLSFPTFRDGRAYSQARQLREQYQFRGELRANGEILRDQFLFLIRAGFNSLDVKKALDADAWAQTVSRYTVFYQPTGDGRETAPLQRLEHPTAPRT